MCGRRRNLQIPFPYFLEYTSELCVHAANSGNSRVVETSRRVQRTCYHAEIEGKHEHIGHVVVVCLSVVESTLYHRITGLFDHEFELTGDAVDILQGSIPFFDRCLERAYLSLAGNANYREDISTEDSDENEAPE